MNVISLEEEAFYNLYYKLVTEIKQQLGAKPRDKWIDGNEAMAMLRIKEPRCKNCAMKERSGTASLSLKSFYTIATVLTPILKNTSKKLSNGTGNSQSRISKGL